MAPVAHATTAPAQTITSSSTNVSYHSQITISGSGWVPGLGVWFTFDGTPSTSIEDGQTKGAAFIGQESLFCFSTLGNCGGSAGDNLYVVPDAAGNFQITMLILDNTGGALTVVANQVISQLTQTMTLTMQPSLSLGTAPNFPNGASGFPLQTIAEDLTVHGFGNSEPVTFSSAAFYESLPSCTTPIASAANPGKCSTGGFEVAVAETPGGSGYAVTASGALSHETAMKDYTVMPYIVLTTTPPGVATLVTTTFSINAGLSTPAVYIEGFGLQSGSIPANSIVFNGFIGSTPDNVATHHSAITVDALGVFGSQSYAGSSFTPVTTCDNGVLATWAGTPTTAYTDDNCQVAVAAVTNLPLGLTSITIQGTVFNWNNGNIFYGDPSGANDFTSNECAFTTGGSCPGYGVGPWNIAAAVGNGYSAVSFGGPFLASVPGTPGTGVGTTTLWALFCDTATLSSCSSQSVGSVSAMPAVFGATPIALFGTGFDSAPTANLNLVTPGIDNALINPGPTFFQCTDTTGKWSTSCDVSGVFSGSDPNGAFYAVSSVPEEGYTHNGYVIGSTAEQPAGPLAQLTSTLFITPWIDLSGATHLAGINDDPTAGITLNANMPVSGGTNIFGGPEGGVALNPDCLSGYQLSDSAFYFDGCSTADSFLAVHGFEDSSTVTFNLGGVIMSSKAAGVTKGFGSVSATDVEDFPSGTYTISGTDNGAYAATASAANMVAFVPVVLGDAQSPTQLQEGNTGGYVSGTFVTLVSGVGTGIHGLAPSTKYNVLIGFGSSAVPVTSFTSTSGGWVPQGGVPLTLPSSLTAGDWSFVIQNAATGQDAMYQQVISDYGFIVQPYPPNYSPLAVNDFASQYGDLWFLFFGSLAPVPGAVMVGQTITVSATGLFPDTPYVVPMDCSGPIVFCPASTGPILATFTSTNTGGGTFTFVMPPSAGQCSVTNPLSPNGCGQPPASGTAYYTLYACSTGGLVVNEYPGGHCDGVGKLNLLPSATLSASSGAPGTSVTVTANGLQPGISFEVYWNYQLALAGDTFTGTPVAAMVANSAGVGTATFTVPSSATPGNYVIQVSLPGDISTTDVELSQAPSFTVISTTEGSNSLSAGSPSQTTVSGNPAVSITYTNTLGTPLTAVAYGIVSNSAGQIVYYTTATITLSPSGSQTAYLVLAGLPHGAYSVSIFAVSTDNIVVSQVTSASVTV